eukprot:COSAG02_NODE_3668_length_6398_cov_3.344975_12_plen_55_part_01
MIFSVPNFRIEKGFDPGQNHRRNLLNCSLPVHHPESGMILQTISFARIILSTCIK